MLTCWLCVTLLDDAFVAKFLPRRSFSTVRLHRSANPVPESKPSRVWSALDFCVLVGLFVATLYYSHLYFGLNLVKGPDGPYLDVAIKFDKREWLEFLKFVVPLTVKGALYAFVSGYRLTPIRVCYLVFVLHSIWNLVVSTERMFLEEKRPFGALFTYFSQIILIGLSFYLLLYSAHIYSTAYAL